MEYSSYHPYGQHNRSWSNSPQTMAGASPLTSGSSPPISPRVTEMHSSSTSPASGTYVTSPHSSSLSTPSEFMSAPLQLYDLNILENGIEDLYLGSAENPNASQLLEGIVVEIYKGLWLDETMVDFLALSHRNLFFCPSPRCLKHREGFDRIERVRDHIWAHHLGRHFLCLWNNCSSTFKQEDGWKVHVKGVHKGDKQKPTCHVCSSSFSGTYNLNRHLKDVHKLQITPRIRNSVDRQRC